MARIAYILAAILVLSAFALVIASLNARISALENARPVVPTMTWQV